MMIFVNGLIVGFLLGVCAFGVLVILMLAHYKRPAPPPTKFRRMTRAENPVEIASATEIKRRMYRDAVVEVPPPWEREEGGIDYRFINMTGEER